MELTIVNSQNSLRHTYLDLLAVCNCVCVLQVFTRAVYHMLHEALGRELNAEERFAAMTLTGDPSLLVDHRDHTPACTSE